MSSQVHSDAHLNVENALKNEMRSGRFSHALLLSGQKGIGKKTLARYLAKGILCTHENHENRPCGICRSCRRFDSGTLPGFLLPAVKPGDKSIKIEPIRDILNVLSRHNLEGGSRVVLIENAERMTVQAQNCLLKTLEEAAGDTYFILTTDAERVILPTILSRCRIERMQPWTDERMADELRKLGIERSRMEELIALSEGNIGHALSIQQDPAFWNARETVHNVFFNVSKPSDIPLRLSLLKEKKDESTQYLDILEQEVHQYLRDKTLTHSADKSPAPLWDKAPVHSLQCIMDAILSVRRMRNANVGWQSAAEQLLQIISEETSLWQR